MHHGYAESRRTLVSFAQKVDILSDRLVVAWADHTCRPNERPAGFCRRSSSRQSLSRADILMELEAIDPNQIDELHLIGLLVTDVRGTTILASQFSLGGVPGTKVPGLGTVYAAGTGRKEFVRLLRATDWTMDGVANEFQVAHGIVAALIDLEYRHGDAIENRWGGGFEAVTFASDSRRFQKVGDILHTFWTVDMRSPDKAQFVPMFYKTTYWRDALIIRYARFDAIAERPFQLAMNSFEFNSAAAESRKGIRS